MGSEFVMCFLSFLPSYTLLPRCFWDNHLEICSPIHFPASPWYHGLPWIFRSSVQENQWRSLLSQKTAKKKHNHARKRTPRNLGNPGQSCPKIQETIANKNTTDSSLPHRIQSFWPQRSAPYALDIQYLTSWSPRLRVWVANMNCVHSSRFSLQQFIKCTDFFQAQATWCQKQEAKSWRILEVFTRNGDLLIIMIS